MKHKGFTVLEFLIVVAIMSILVGLILVGLTAARANARDQEKIAKLQRVALGIEQYHDICRQYPANLDDQQTCSELQGSTFSKLVPDIMDFQFNISGSNYNYAPIALDGNDLTSCSSFHLWVQLEKERETNASRFNSQGTTQCWSNNPMTVNATTDLTIYDIHK